VDVLALCVTDDDDVREITTGADDQAAFRPGLTAVSHGTGDPQIHERGRHAAGWLAGAAHLLASPAGARS
jgi:3-hydroxyisobutyrate dehydrogenase-like beta-hydroxyacid dehydrogenase